MSAGARSHGPAPRSHGRAALWLVPLVAASLVASCKKKEEERPITASVPQGAASNEELVTGLGPAKGLPPSLAPTSTKWSRIVVLDGQRAILAGDVTGESIAIVTTDAGRTWRSIHTEPGAYASWSVGDRGALVYARGDREQLRKALPAGQLAPIDSMRIAFAGPNAEVLGPAADLLAPGPAKGKPRVLSATGQLAVLSPESAALLVEGAPRKDAIFYGAPPGFEPAPPTPFPPAERAIPTPYGRPPSVLTTAGKGLLVRPIPGPGAPLPVPQPVADLVVTPTLLAELSQPPACEMGAWSFQRVTQPGRNVLFGVSPTKTVAFTLPVTTASTTPIGCGADRVIVRTQPVKDGKPEGAPSLATCALDGACVEPEVRPFRVWAVPHEHTITAVPTSRGAVALMSSRAGDRWGLYLAQSTDGGELYDLPRAVGEGASDRGRIELSAILSFGERVVILMTTDVIGTSRRGFYVTASDDGGTTWNVP